MDITALALDMDGTVLDDKNIISERLVTILNKLHDKGIRIFIATGRTKKEVDDVLPEGVPIDGFVTANGMGCFTDKAPVYQHTLPPELVKDVLELARERKLYYEIHPNDGSRFALKDDKTVFENELNAPKADTLKDNEYFSRSNAVRKIIQWVDTINCENIVKAYFFSMKEDRINDWIDQLCKMKEERDFSYTSSSLHNVEIKIGNVSKATGIQKLLEIYGLSSKNLLAVGDSENDIPMFQLAAYSAAMKNAETYIQEKTKEVTAYTNNEDGLAEYLLEKFQALL